MKKTGGILTAAGLSSRMHDFKPLLPYGGTSIARHMVGLMQACGADPVVVVTGYRAEELEAHLADTGACFVRNERYRETDMFASVCLGLHALEQACDRVMLLPVDLAGISEEIVRQAMQIDAPLVRTTCGGRPGHPILIDRDVIPRICAYRGDKGLKGAMETCGVPITELSVEDDRIYFDADTPEDYRLLLARSRTAAPDCTKDRPQPDCPAADRSRTDPVPAQPGPARTLYLVRHGSVAFPDGTKRCIGRTDLPLSEDGRHEAGYLADYFKEHPVEAVYCSPLLRAQETARILADGRYPVRTEPGLLELDMGEWENLPMDVLKRDFKKELESEPEHGESRKEGLKRFRETVQNLLSETGDDIVCVSHAGILCCYLSYLLGTPLATSRAIRQPYGGISRVTFDTNGQYNVTMVGEMPRVCPDPAQCRALWNRCGTPEPVRRHCEAVCAKALQIAEALQTAGHTIDIDLVESAALLHDVLRTEKNHPAAGAALLEKAGYPQTARIIAVHHDLTAADGKPVSETASEPVSLEAKIVYLADKLTRGTETVTLKERFVQSREKCMHAPNPAEALRAHERRYAEAVRTEEEIRSLIARRGD